jgi:hypothetical protein
MKTNTDKVILDYIQEKKSASPGEIVEFLGISHQAVHRQLKKLVDSEKLLKVGRAPKVRYMLNVTLWADDENIGTVRADRKQIIDDRYIYISPLGKMSNGFAGFVAWCKKTKQPVFKTAEEYVMTLRKYDAFKKGGVIDGREKFQSTFHTLYLDHVYYVDFYSIERFGKTKLGQLLLYAKQSQNMHLMRTVTNEVKPTIDRIIRKYHIDAVAFIPPSVKRTVQFMTEFSKLLRIPLPHVGIIKVTGDIVVPQKSLSKLSDRIENAANSIFVTEKQVYRNILVIDDAVGSGATLNETARKIREQNICTGKIIGLAITGSFKGFDVISEI